eukprot:SAG22_NODE_4589_length_1224_cov_1.451556_1_plen_291_part_00
MSIARGPAPCTAVSQLVVAAVEAASAVHLTAVVQVRRLPVQMARGLLKNALRVCTLAVCQHRLSVYAGEYGSSSGGSSSSTSSSSAYPPPSPPTVVPNLVVGVGSRISDTGLAQSVGTCYPPAAPSTLSLADCDGSLNGGDYKVLVIATFYTGCAPGRHIAPDFAEASAAMQQFYGYSVQFIASVKGSSSCATWAGQKFNLDGNANTADAGAPIALADTDSVLHYMFSAATLRLRWLTRTWLSGRSSGTMATPTPTATCSASSPHSCLRSLLSWLPSRTMWEAQGQRSGV